MTDQSTTDPFNLRRFLDAQAGIGFTPYDTALAEMKAGHKQSHWIWYVFPQIKLGTSSLSEHFAIKSPAEAEAYLTNDTLRSRYFDITTEVLHRLEEGVNPTFLMGGSTDLRKLISSLTLFEGIPSNRHQIEVRRKLFRCFDLLEQFSRYRCEDSLIWLRDKRFNNS